MTVCYLELPAPDLDLALAFYRDVFAWRISASDLTDAPYWMFSTGEGGLAGALDPSVPVAPGAGPLLYLAVDDIDATLAAIERAGGRVARERFAIGGDFGFSAHFDDPNGNRLGLWSKI